MKHEELLRYLDNRRISLIDSLTHQPADTHLERVAFRWEEGEDGKREEKAERRPFGDHLTFLHYIYDQAGSASPKPILVLGDSGLGKTWLFLRTFAQIAAGWSDGVPIPFYLSLRGETLSLSPEEEEALSLLPPAKRDLLAKRLSRDPAKNLAERIKNEAGIEALSDCGPSVVLFLDGLNEMPAEGQRNLFAALKTGFPRALWIFSGQPHVLESIDEVRTHRGLEARLKPWDFFFVQPVMSTEHLEQYLKVLLPEEKFRPAIANYFEKLSAEIWRNPRYLFHVCKIIQKWRDEENKWPTKLGEILEVAIGGTLEGHLKEAGVHDSELAHRVSLQKVLLGCLGIYEMLSGRKQLMWWSLGKEGNVWEWVKSFQQAGVLPKEGVIEELDQLRQRGPLAKGSSGNIVFDHDTTKDYAVTCLVRHLLVIWPLGQHEEFKQWLILALLVHLELGKILPILVDLMDFRALRIDERLLCDLRFEHLNSFAVCHSQIRLPLMERLECARRDLADDFVLDLVYVVAIYEVRTVLAAMSGAVNDPGVRKAMLETLEHAAPYVIEALSGAVSVPEVRLALLERVNDRDKTVRLKAVKALSGTLSDPEIQRVLLARVNDEDWQIRRLAALALSKTLNDPWTRETLLNKLEDAGPDVSTNVIEALSKAVNEPEVRQALLKSLEDHSEHVRVKAIMALSGAVSDPEVRQALSKTLEDGDEWVRGCTTEALSGAVNNTEVRQALLKSLEDHSKHVRVKAIVALSGVVSDPEVRQALSKTLEDGDEWVRGCTTEALSGAVNVPEVRRVLLERLEDHNQQVCLKAIVALSGAVSDPEVRNALVDRATDKFKDVRKAAIKALSGAVSDPEVRNALVDRARDKFRDVRKAAIKALSGAVSEPQVRTALLENLVGYFSCVREAAAKALKAVVNEPEVRTALVGRLNDDDDGVRRSAAEALGCPSLTKTIHLKNAATAMRYVTANLRLLDPQGLSNALYAAKQASESPRDLNVYRVLHQLRHNAKGDGKENLPGILDELLRERTTQKPTDIFQRRTSTLYLKSEEGKPLPPVFNIGTYAVSTFLNAVEQYQYGDWVTAQKDSLREIFSRLVCDQMGFHAEKSLNKWIASLAKEDVKLEIIGFSSMGENQQHIVGDEEVFREILMQFLVNALSFAQKSVKVSVFTYSASDPTILVADDGPGIRPDLMKTRFDYGETSRRDKGGEGKGLTPEIPHKLHLMGFELYALDNERQWYWIRSSNGVEVSIKPCHLKGEQEEKESIESQLFNSGAAFLIMQK